MKNWICACPGCGHEWQGERNTCDWCNTEGRLLEETPALPINKMAKSIGNFFNKSKHIRKKFYTKPNGESI